ncbi:MAG: adenylate/guanylate cyclase domain-containing protein, partial [Acidimicrobiia bacterium]
MVAFLLTDIEGSSRLWELHPSQMRDALAAHDRLLRRAISANGGRVFATAGDSLAAAFNEAADAVRAAVEGQIAISNLVAGDDPVKVRMAINAGEAEERDGDYFGQVLNRCGRLRDAAHGGQVVISGAVRALVGDGGGGLELLDLGEHRLRDLELPEQIFQVAHPDLPVSFPPLRTLTKATTNFPIQLSSFVGRHQEM